MAQILDGKKIAREIQEETRGEVDRFMATRNIQPCLAAVLVGEDPASEVYVRNKRRDCERVGIQSQLHQLPANAATEELNTLVDQLNASPDVHGILVQLPLPSQMEETSILDRVHPLKDVDAFHPQNVGRLAQGRSHFLPCTPHGIQQLLHRTGISVCGQHVVVVGRSDIVGKPLAMMLMQRDSTCGPEAANATVTVCHSRSNDLKELTRQADILVAAIGRPRHVTADMVRPGATVIDVGINRTEDGLCGDVDFDSVSEVASHITPVPGGVGPLTRAMLLQNTLIAARLQTNAQNG